MPQTSRQHKEVRQKVAAVMSHCPGGLFDKKTLYSVYYNGKIISITFRTNQIKHLPFQPHYIYLHIQVAIKISGLLSEISLIRGLRKST